MQRDAILCLQQSSGAVPLWIPSFEACSPETASHSKKNQSASHTTYSRILVSCLLSNFPQFSGKPHFIMTPFAPQIADCTTLCTACKTQGQSAVPSPDLGSNPGTWHPKPINLLLSISSDHYLSAKLQLEVNMQYVSSATCTVAICGLHWQRAAALQVGDLSKKFSSSFSGDMRTTHRP